MTRAAGSPPEGERAALVIRRIVPGSPERVFTAWTDPAHMGRWMAPSGKARVELDVRVGGALRVVMEGTDWEIEHTGEYREVDPPHRLVFTWRSNYTGDGPSLVTVELRAHGTGRGDAAQTELTLRHEELPPERVESHRGGWGLILSNLEKHLAGEG